MLEGKVAIVTGAGRGLGRAYARALAAAGAAVVVNDMDGEAADAVTAEITQAGGRATAVAAAVGDTETADALVKAAVDHFGALDILVTNAGVLRDRTVTRMTEEDFDVVIRTHLRGTFTCARAAFTQFRAQGGGGRLILVGSPAGQRASFGQANYSAAKAGIVGMARTLANEGRKYGIAVNAIIPVALTRMAATIPGLAEIAEAVESGQPVPEKLRSDGLGTADDVAPLVVVLASLDAEVTGQVFGAGGDRVSLWSHPQEVEVGLRPGGWTAETLAAEFPRLFLDSLQDYQPGGASAEQTGTGA
jgi:NAD(P)-dependent dehydrogenase (short-subunit alcohol dehydrogenase family)